MGGEEHPVHLVQNYVGLTMKLPGKKILKYFIKLKLSF